MHALKRTHGSFMLIARIIVVLFCSAISLVAAAAPKLVAFVEANGCKILGDASTVKRLQEIAAQGTVAWDGQCKRGLIEGKGVLRQEGTLTVDGKIKNYVYFLSGSARKGQRQGPWRRETFDRFAGSPKFYTSAAAVKFYAGVARGKPRLVVIKDLAQLSPAFRQFVIDAQKEAEPANPALRYRQTAAPVALAPPVIEAPDSRPPIKPSATAGPRVTASSQSRQMGAEGLLALKAWQSASPPAYPETLVVDFQTGREIKMIGMLMPTDNQTRAPKIVRIESSDDSNAWTSQAASEIPCAPNADDGWLNLGLLAVAKGRYLKIVIIANCGDPEFVAVRGLRFK